MAAPDYRAANRILAAVLERPEVEQAAALEELCAGDAELFALVSRLHGHALSDDPLVDGLPRGALWREAMTALTDRASLPPGDPLGQYRILRRLGYGGTAEVYLAERVDAELRQEVAVKILRADLDNPISAERFRQEQSILARLNHPHIGHIYDVGRTGDGRPYFVMEYVDGQPIDQFCDSRALNVRERLVLFVDVASAVAYAHAQLVVHRDIKPSNVLVDRDGRAKLVDFGIAKLLADNGGDGLTATGTSPATLGFASPEQLSGAAVGVTSDVYQLGVLLYVLLAGVRPYEARGLDRSELATLAAHGDHATPSGRIRRLVVARDATADVETIARRRRVSAGQLARQLGGDLDKIVERAMQPQPDARYASVAHLIDDVRNHLEGRPVLASGRGRWYVLSRFLRRHRIASAVVATLLLGLVAFSVVVSVLALNLERARLLNERQRAAAPQVLEFLVDTFRELEPEKSGGAQSLVKQALDRAAAAPEARFGTDAAVHAERRMLLARAYVRTEDWAGCREQFERALAAAGALDAEYRRRTEHRALQGVATCSRKLGDNAQAKQAFLRLAQQAQADDDAQVTYAYAMAGVAEIEAAVEGDIARARERMQQSIAVLTRVSGAAHPNTLRMRSNATRFLMQDERRSPRDDLVQAVELAVALAQDASAALGAESEDALRMRLDVAWAHAYLGEHTQAVAGLRSLLPVAQRVLGEQHLNVLISRRLLALALADAGDVDAGLAEIERVVAIVEERLPATHPNVGLTRFDHAVLLALAGRDEDAVGRLQSPTIDARLIATEPRIARLRTDARVAARLAEAAPH